MLRKAATLFFLAAVSSTSRLALADQVSSGAGPVIPAGREPLVLRMVCERPDAPLPGGCACDGVAIDHTFIRAKYACPGQPEAIIELRHPSASPRGPENTAHFSLTPRGASPTLLQDVTRRVRAAESAWTWTAAAPRPGGPPGSGQFPLILALLAVAALSVTWWAHSSPPPAAA